jgi:hypothetical protein
MRRGTTPTIKVHLKNIELEYLENIYITLRQNNYVLTKTNEDLICDSEENIISTTLTQAETLEFTNGIVEIQLRAIAKDGKAVASGIITRTMEDILQEGEIE